MDQNEQVAQTEELLRHAVMATALVADLGKPTTELLENLVYAAVACDNDDPRKRDVLRMAVAIMTAYLAVLDAGEPDNDDETAH